MLMDSVCIYDPEDDDDEMDIFQINNMGEIEYILFFVLMFVGTSIVIIDSKL